MNQPSTRASDQGRQLVENEGTCWKRLLDAHPPYRWNLVRLKLGFTVEIGCGRGRTLQQIHSNGVGIHHNPASVDIAQSRGLLAFLPHLFGISAFNQPDKFDSLLLAHVVEPISGGDSSTLSQIRRRTGRSKRPADLRALSYG